MLDTIPNAEETTALVGKSLCEVWSDLCALIDEHYDDDFIRLLSIKRKPNKK